MGYIALLRYLFLQGCELLQKSTTRILGFPSLYEGYVVPAIHHLLGKLALCQAESFPHATQTMGNILHSIVRNIVDDYCAFAYSLRI